jgi:hypothetical protein
VLASTHERALDIVPLDALRQHSVDVPADLSTLEELCPLGGPLSAARVVWGIRLTPWRSRRGPSDGPARR